MDLTPEVVTLGECMILVYPTKPVEISIAENLNFDLAGAESNFAIALSRLNHSTRFISRVGNDPFGEFIRSKLTDEGVCLDSLGVDDNAPTGLFFREWLKDGNRRVYYYRSGSAASRIGPEDIQSEMLKGVRLAHLTGITPSLSETAREASIRFIHLAKQAGAMISFDPNYRSPLWNYSDARRVMVPLIEKSDFLLLGHEDAKALFDETDDLRILEITASLGPRIVVLKRAERGTLASIDGNILESKPFPVEKIFDPVGAGDGFDAGFIAGWLRGWDFPKAIDLGAKIGALAVQTMGDYHGYPRGI